MRVRVDRGPGRIWRLTISGGSDPTANMQSFIRATLILVLLNIATVTLAFLALQREVMAGYTLLVALLFTALPLIMLGIAQYPWWRRVYQALRRNSSS